MEILYTSGMSTFWSRRKQLMMISGMIGLSSVLRSHQHSIGYMGDGFLQVKISGMI